MTHIVKQLILIFKQVDKDSVCLAVLLKKPHKLFLICQSIS